MTTFVQESPVDVSCYGIHDCGIVYYNPSYELLYQHETSRHTAERERGVTTSTGAVAIHTGRFTGRSPKDKFFVDTPNNALWWRGEGKAANSDNKKLSPESWQQLRQTVSAQLRGAAVYVIDGFCGANPNTRIAVRLVTEIAWQAHFFKNMFIRPSEAELEGFEPDWVILNACKATADNPEALGLNSEVFVAFNLDERMTLIGGTWYGGEIKKGMFTMMNYFLPLRGIGAFHCSANQGKDGDSCLFFGLSGTGKTTLSTDPQRELIGDDEHGWDDDGIFNFEGGCYAKTIDLSEANEPDIWHAIKRDALLENVVVGDGGAIDYADTSITTNGRVSYPIDHIAHHVGPRSVGAHPKHVIFLTCDAFGVLPPVAKLTHDQALYQFLSGYTAKIAGTELGVTEPQATFSPCFGGPFLSLHPLRYAEILRDKLKAHGTKCYLVNTGWTGGPYGTGKRMPLGLTRHIIDSIHDGSVEDVETWHFPMFDFEVPMLSWQGNDHWFAPRDTWDNTAAYDDTLAGLVRRFSDNFDQFTDQDLGAFLCSCGPRL